MQVSKEQEEEFKKRFKPKEYSPEEQNKNLLKLNSKQLKDWDKCLQQEIS